MVRLCLKSAISALIDPSCRGSKEAKARQHGLPDSVAGVEQPQSEREAPPPLSGARVTQARGLWVVPQVAPSAVAIMYTRSTCTYHAQLECWTALSDGERA